MSFKIGVLKNLQYSQENTCVGVSNIVAGQKTGNFIWKTATQMFSCEFYEIFKNSFHEVPLMWYRGLVIGLDKRFSLSEKLRNDILVI